MGLQGATTRHKLSTSIKDKTIKDNKDKNGYNIYGTLQVLVTKPSSNMGKKHALLLLQLLLLLQVNPGNCRYIAPKYSSSGQVSNGGGEVQQPAFVVFEHRPSPYSCKQTHGVMPCTTTVFGNVFLILVYGYLMFFAARLLYDGSEILVELLSPGITGGVFLPLLSSLPDAIIILGKLDVS